MFTIIQYKDVAMNHMDDKGTALVTGASSGIGAAYAEALAKRGHNLILTARDEARLTARAARLRAEAGVLVEVLPADLTAPAGLATVARRLREDSAITLLINNAGMNASRPLAESDPNELAALMALNVAAPVQLAAAAAQGFAARGRGGIVNIASVLALAPEMSDAVYAGTKAFILAMTQKLHLELAPLGIQVQAVLPGLTRTEIFERSGRDLSALPPGMIMEPEELVEAALAGLSQGELVTIPSLADPALWNAFEAARRALGPHLSLDHAAARYQTAS